MIDDDEAVRRVLAVEAPRSNPALAPRMRRCVVCKEVAALEDVAYRLFDETGQHIGNGTRHAAEYLRSVGMGGSPQTIRNRLVRHRDHIDSWLGRGGAVVPAHVEAGVQRIPEPAGPTRWLDAQQNAINLGNEALRLLAGRLDRMEDRDVIAVAKLGTVAAGQRGALEAKGKALSQVDQLLRLIAGAGA